jgi:hypothetical protein
MGSPVSVSLYQPSGSGSVSPPTKPCRSCSSAREGHLPGLRRPAPRGGRLEGPLRRAVPGDRRQDRPDALRNARRRRDHKRDEPLRADYVLEYEPHLPVAVVEAKREHKRPGDGLQQAMRYAGMLRLPLAYSTNGKAIVEHDYDTGLEKYLDSFPTPEEVAAVPDVEGDRGRRRHRGAFAAVQPGSPSSGPTDQGAEVLPASGNRGDGRRDPQRQARPRPPHARHRDGQDLQRKTVAR